MARASYSLKVAEKICSGIASGKLLAQVCKRPGMPSVSAVFSWLDKHPAFAELYTRAKELQADAIAADTLRIADQVREGKKTEEKQVGWACSKCDKDLRWRGAGWIHSLSGTSICEEAKAEKLVEVKTQSGDMVDRARLMVDTRKWLLAKMAPKRYGERLELAGDKDAPLQITVSRMDRP